MLFHAVQRKLITSDNIQKYQNLHKLIDVFLVLHSKLKKMFLHYHVSLVTNRNIYKSVVIVVTSTVQI